MKGKIFVLFFFFERFISLFLDSAVATPSVLESQMKEYDQFSFFSLSLPLYYISLSLKDNIL